MELRLSRALTIRNTSLSSDDGSVSYYIQTPWRWVIRKSTITKWTGAKRELVATIDWTIFKLPKVNFRDDMTIDSEKFLRRAEINKFTKHIVTLPNGEELEWHSLATPELFKRKHDGKKLLEKGERLAFYKHANWFTKRHGVLVVAPEAVDFLDYVVVSFIIVEEFRRERDSQGFSNA